MNQSVLADWWQQLEMGERVALLYYSAPICLIPTRRY
jgi:hypothetical protein